MGKKRIKQTGLSFYAKVKFLDGRVISRRAQSKRKVFNFLSKEHGQFKWIYIRVTYKSGIYNDGKYYYGHMSDALYAWDCFTNEDLIKEALTY